MFSDNPLETNGLKEEPQVIHVFILLYFIRFIQFLCDMLFSRRNFNYITKERELKKWVTQMKTRQKAASVHCR